MTIVLFEKQHLLEYINQTMENDEAQKFLIKLRNAYGLNKKFEEFLSNPEVKYAHARYILNILLFYPSIKASTYLGYLKETNLISNLKEVPLKISSRFQKCFTNNQKKFVIFLDGDNLSNLLSFSKLRQYASRIDFHVCLILTRDIINDSMMGYEHEEWLSIIYSETKEKDAADNCITFLMARVDVILDDNQYDFVLVTRDHFYREITSQFYNYFTRACYHAKDMDGLVDLLENGEQIKKRRCYSPISEEITQNSQNSIEIMNLNLDEPPSPDFLISFFKSFWIGSGNSQACFCRGNTLNPTNFSKHINCKKYNTSFNQKLEEYFTSFLDYNALSNHVIRVNQNVVPIHTYKKGDILRVGNTFQTFAEIQLDNETKYLTHKLSIHDMTLILEIVDGRNVNVREID